jgi:hypothetical protein
VAHELEVTTRGDGARCPFCREPVGEAEASWTCPRCAARQHEECLREVGDRCAACNEPGPDVARAKVAAEVNDMSARLAATFAEATARERLGGLALLVQAAGFVAAAAVGGLVGGQAALILVALVFLFPITLGVLRAPRDGFEMAAAFLVVNGIGFALTAVAVDALDVPRRRGSPQMVLIALALAGVSWWLGRWLRPRA